MPFLDLLPPELALPLWPSVAELASTEWLADHAPDALLRLCRDAGLRAHDFVLGACDNTAIARIAYRVGRRDGETLLVVAPPVTHDLAAVSHALAVTSAIDTGAPQHARSVFATLLAAAYAKGVWDAVLQATWAADEPSAASQLARAAERAVEQGFGHERGGTSHDLEAAAETQAHARIGEAWSAFARGEAAARRQVLEAGAELAALRDAVRMERHRRLQNDILGYVVGGRAPIVALRLVARAAADPSLDPRTADARAAQFAEYHADWILPALDVEAAWRTHHPVRPGAMQTAEPRRWWLVLGGRWTRRPAPAFTAPRTASSTGATP